MSLIPTEPSSSVAYQALARKWRPRKFSEVVGQQHVLKALTHALDDNRVHHAFLFTGTRGVGKTTIARIFAKSLNCETGVSSSPCGVCSSCVDIDAGRFVDLVEIDAASRTGVDDMRELIDNVQYAPARGRTKVYLIDEVHMLSTSAFNALLKTLEEPPEHVKFLLATTDPQKLPITILSRCLQFSLKRLTAEQISAHLNDVLGKEAVPYDDEASYCVAEAADGSMRDALSLLDQAIPYGDGQLKVDVVREMLGLIDSSFIEKLLTHLAGQNADAMLSTAAELAQQAPDYAQMLDELMTALQKVALQQVVGGSSDLTNNGLSEALLSISTLLPAQHVQLLYDIALRGKRDLPYAANPKLGFDMTLLRMLAFAPEQVKKKVASQSAQLDKPAKPAQNTVTEPEQAKPVQNAHSLNHQSDKNNDATVASNVDVAAEVSAAKKPERVSEVINESELVNVSQPENTPNFAPSVAAKSDSVQEKTEADALAAAFFDDDQVNTHFTETQPSNDAFNALGDAHEKYSASLHESPDNRQSDAQKLDTEKPSDQQLTSNQVAAQGQNTHAQKIRGQDESNEHVKGQHDEVTAAPAVTKNISDNQDSAHQHLGNNDVLPEGWRDPNWPVLVSELNLGGAALQLARNSIYRRRNGNRILLALDETNSQMANASMRSKLSEALSQFFGETLVVDIELAKPDEETPAQRSDRERQEQQNLAEQAILTDPNVKRMQTLFDAEIIDGSIAPLNQ